MTTRLQPIKSVKCTFEDCPASFDTEKQMKAHKKSVPEHDYCYRCDKDFESYEEYTQHKVWAPDKHGKACRVCGEEFKSTAGLSRHIEVSHKVDQKLPCIGCGQQFFRPSLLIEHLELGSCEKITAVEFQGHIVHKYLVAELLKGGANYTRFMEKISRYDASVDYEDEGGISLMDDEGSALDIDYEAIKPEILDTPGNKQSPGPYPPLPKSKASGGPNSALASHFSNMSVSRRTESVASGGIESPTESRSVSTARTPKAWVNGTSKALFPNVRSTETPSVYSVEQHDRRMERTEGINILKTRFWDPTTPDWNPERFYDTMLQKYFCPFVCEQSFLIPRDLNGHILNDHRITQMRCPSCHKIFGNCHTLVAHCESGSKRCKIREAYDFGTFLDRLTGGFLSVQEHTRPDHIHNPTVKVKNPETGEEERYKPPTATYLKYAVTKPVDWKDKDEKITYTIGRQHNSPYLN